MQQKEMPRLDVTKYIGKDVHIAKAIIETTDYGKCVKVTSDIIPLENGDKLPDGKYLTAGAMLSFGFDKETKKYFIGIGSKLQKFLIAHQIDPITIPEDIPDGMELISFFGKKCKCQKNEKGYLELV